MPAGEADPAVLPLTICNEAAVLASGNKYAGAGGGGDGGREGEGKSARGKRLICLFCH